MSPDRAQAHALSIRTRAEMRLVEEYGAAQERGDPRKLALLMALVALAIIWAGRRAADTLGTASPRRKAHGYFAQSRFRVGFDTRKAASTAAQ